MSTKRLGRPCWLALFLPLLAAGCERSAIDELGGAKRLLEDFPSLHQRVYEVYSLEDAREGVWELLAQVFAGEALTREYVEHFTTLARMRREGTAIEVLAVDYESVSLVDDENGALVEADWSVAGIVHHQRHRHLRINRYRALYRVAQRDDTAELRIVDTRMLGAERVQTSPSLSRGFPLDALPTSERGLLGPAELLRSGLLDQATREPGEEQ